MPTKTVLLFLLLALAPSFASSQEPAARYSEIEWVTMMVEPVLGDAPAVLGPLGSVLAGPLGGMMGDIMDKSNRPLKAKIAWVAVGKIKPMSDQPNYMFFHVNLKTRKHEGPYEPGKNPDDPLRPF